MDEKEIIGRFQAMSCPCEILLHTTDKTIGDEQLRVARGEAERIESLYSRYRKGNIIDRINTSDGKRLEVDAETAALLDYAAHCYEMSDGLFDITTGVLRKGSDISLVGWNKVIWERPFIQLPAGFEIDFGGICKEYAADRIVNLLRKRHDISTLVNLGGDIAAEGDRLWSVGIEDVSRPGQVARTLHLRKGAIATSGTTKRVGHILNPKTGKPIENAPESVTVAAATCTEAGFWSTFAILQGDQAEVLLKEQGLEFFCYRRERLSA